MLNDCLLRNKNGICTISTVKYATFYHFDSTQSGYTNYLNAKCVHQLPSTAKQLKWENESFFD